MKKPLFATVALVTVLLLTSVEIVGAVSVVHRVHLSGKQVSKITGLFTDFKRKNHEFKAKDRVTLELDKSIFASTYKKSKPGLKNYLAERYNSHLYVFATFSLMPHDSFRAQVSMQDGGSDAIFTISNGRWRIVQAEIGWPPCHEQYLATLVPKPVAHQLALLECTVPGLIYSSPPIQG